MIKKIHALLLGLFCCLVTASAQNIQSPSTFLGYQLGDQFTYHYRIVEYFKYVAQNSKNIKLVQYGATNEGRPLIAAFIASDENIGRLEDIRHNNMRLAGFEDGKGSTSMPVVVWLSYNVHGNEPASSEAAMQTLFDLVDPANARTKPWLKNTVVVIDPCLNPDGRDRYVNFYNQTRGIKPDANPGAREHQEPWPGGRVNHYYFDLNRDWAWQTQKEVQERVGLYNQWLPQIHVDFHEQNYNNPYYFAPAAEPFHRDITAWQRQFQTVIGKNNAKYFDQNGWMYFTKQEFDLLYPSYGDTYPIYNGSIGMTYEQGGISAGLAVITRSGDTLTLAERIAHHHSNGLSTVETASAYAQRVLTEYKKYFEEGRKNPPGEFKTYVIHNDNQDKINALAHLLDKNRISYGFGARETVTGCNYFTGRTEPYHVDPKDMVINAHQPKAVLLNVLLEPKTFVADSNTYDITAWSLPYVYGLQAYGLKQSIRPGTVGSVPNDHKPAVNMKAYAYVVEWQSVEDVKFLAALLKENVKVRFTQQPFTAAGRKFNPGALIITRAGNGNIDFDPLITQTALKYHRVLYSLASGFVEKGADIGSNVIHYLHRPKVMLMSGEGVNSEAMGEVWHFFEQEIDYPVTLVRFQDLNKVKLADFDVAIFPDGAYHDFPSEKLQGWINDGGKLIAMGDAVAELARTKGFIRQKEEKTDAKKKKQVSFAPFGQREREAIKSTVPGAIFKIDLDNTHPLAYGFPNYYYTLKLSDDIYDYFGDEGHNVGIVKRNAFVAGFAGQKARAKIHDGLLLGVQHMGKGSVIYFVDDPIFRSFWENGKLLLGNAIFMVGN